MTNFRSGLLNQGAPLGAIVQTTTLSADNQAVDVTGVTWLQLSSDNATATARTMTLVPSPLIGHQIYLQNVGATGALELAVGTTMKILSTWTPVQYDTLELISDGTNWIETGRSGVSALPVSVVRFAGTYTTAGGSATEVQTLTGVAATDVVIATLNTKGASPQTILTTKPTLNTITYVFSANPSTDHIISYIVLRAV